MVYMMDPMQQMLSSLSDFNYIPYCVYRIAMKLRFIQKKTRLCHLTVPMWQKIIGELCLENPNLVLEPVEISSVVSTLVRAIAIEVGNDIMVNEDESARLILSWLSTLYPQSTLTCLQLNVPIILLSNSDVKSKHRLLFEVTMLSGYQVTLQQLSHVLHLSSYLILACGENTTLGSSASQNVAQNCFTFCGVPFTRSLTPDLYEKWVLADPEYLSWIPTLYRLTISQNMKHEARCSACKCHPLLGLRYRCLKCVNLDLCQECFLKGVVYKNHDQTHPLKEYIKRGSKSESVKDLTTLVKGYFKAKSSNSSSTRSKSLCVQKGKNYKTNKEKSTRSDEATEYGTIATDDWFERKGKLPVQSPLQYTSCPDLHIPLEDRRMEILQHHTDQLTVEVERLRQEVLMTSPPPYRSPPYSSIHNAYPTKPDTSTSQDPYTDIPDITEPLTTSVSFPNGHHDPSRSLPVSPLQTIAEMAEYFTTDMSLYCGDDRERQPVVGGAGRIGLAMDTFLTELFNKTPPPKPKRSSPNLSKTSLNGTPPSSRHSTTSQSGVDLHLAFDLQNKKRPGYLVPDTRTPDTRTPDTRIGEIYYSTPDPLRRPLPDLGSTCSSIHHVGSGDQRRQLSRLQQNGAGYHDHQYTRTTVLGRRERSDTEVLSTADTSITRSIRQVYQPPLLPLLRAHHESDGASLVSGTSDRSHLVRNYRGSGDDMDLSLQADNSSAGGGSYNSDRKLAYKAAV